MKNYLKKVIPSWKAFTKKELVAYSRCVNKLQVNHRLCITKWCFIIVLFFSFTKIHAQNDSIFETHNQIFSLSPISKRVATVNGLVLGVGFYDSNFKTNQTINGINLEANPTGLVLPFFVFYIPELITKSTHKIHTDSIDVVDFQDASTLITVNGLSVSTGLFMKDAKVNGLQISPFNRIVTMNGVSITGLGLQSDKLNGMSLGLYNCVNTTNGVLVGVFNETRIMRGTSLGFYNYATENKGIQIGIFNMSKSKGLQLGLWNINEKRTLPFINW